MAQFLTASCIILVRDFKVSYLQSVGRRFECGIGNSNLQWFLTFVSRSWAKIWTQSISGLSSFFKLQFWQEASMLPSTSFLAGFSENAITCSICQLPRVWERMSCGKTRIIIQRENLTSSPRFDLMTLTFHENSNRGR